MSAKNAKTTPPEVLAAQEALQRAEHARLAAAAELGRATRARFEVAQALQEARVRADDHLPRAMVFVPAWQGRIAVVIERRTAKTITTRSPGGTQEQQWRKGADGKWRPWPDRGSVRWLEIEGEAE